MPPPGGPLPSVPLAPPADTARSTASSSKSPSSPGTLPVDRAATRPGIAAPRVRPEALRLRIARHPERRGRSGPLDLRLRLSRLDRRGGRSRLRGGRLGLCPDVVWSNSFRALPLLAKASPDIAAVWDVHDCRPEASDLRRAVQCGVVMVAASHFLSDRVRRLSGGECETIYPFIFDDEYLVAPAAEEFVTFINPRPVKGYEIFLGIPPLLPEFCFLVVEGWPLGEVLPVVEAQLAKLPNVRFLRQQSDARAIYRQTRLLLVPSVVEEGGPRVIREAQLNAIPVLGSPRGGVPEIVGDGGLILRDFEEPSAWVDAIRGVLDVPAYWEALSQAALRNAHRPDLQARTILGQFMEACQRARSSGARRASPDRESKMRAAFQDGLAIRVADVPDPSPGPGEVLVAVRAAGICGSTSTAIEGSNPGTACHHRTAALGHESPVSLQGWGKGRRA